MLDPYRLRVAGTIPTPKKVEDVKAEVGHAIICTKNELTIINIESMTVASSIKLEGIFHSISTVEARADSSLLLLAVNTKSGSVLYWLDGLTVTHELELTTRVANVLVTQNK